MAPPPHPKQINQAVVWTTQITYRSDCPDNLSTAKEDHADKATAQFEIGKAMELLHVPQRRMKPPDVRKIREDVSPA